MYGHEFRLYQGEKVGCITSLPFNSNGNYLTIETAYNQEEGPLKISFKADGLGRSFNYEIPKEHKNLFKRDLGAEDDGSLVGKRTLGFTNADSNGLVGLVTNPNQSFPKREEAIGVA